MKLVLVIKSYVLESGEISISLVNGRPGAKVGATKWYLLDDRMINKFVFVYKSIFKCINPEKEKEKGKPQKKCFSLNGQAIKEK